MKKIFLLYITIICLILLPLLTYAHPGRTDANGGHYNRSTGEYHYHTGEYAGRTQSSSNNYTYSPKTSISGLQNQHTPLPTTPKTEQATEPWYIRLFFSIGITIFTYIVTFFIGMFITVLMSNFGIVDFVLEKCNHQNPILQFYTLTIFLLIAIAIPFSIVIFEIFDKEFAMPYLTEGTLICPCLILIAHIIYSTIKKKRNTYEEYPYFIPAIITALFLIGIILNIIY